MSSAAARRNNVRSNPTARPLPHSDVNRMSSTVPASADFHRPPRSQDVEIEGVYKNTQFTFYLTTLVGCTVEVLVQNGKKYEGILKTFSADLEVVLECVHLIDVANRDKTPTKERIIETLIINFTDLVHMSAINADTKFGETDSFTDAAISKSQMNGVIKEKELTPFILESDGVDKSLEELGSASDWTPEKMFKVHEERFGVTSSFDEEQYTTKLPSSDSHGYQQKMAAAERLASQIEASSTSRRNAAVENGDARDEESTFSAVSRPTPPTPPVVTNRYTPPQLRNRDKPGGPKALSQSMRMNGRDGLSGRNIPDRHTKPPPSTTENIEKLKTWTKNFNLSNSGSTAAVPAVEPQATPKVESKPESAGKPAHRTKSPLQSPTTKVSGSHTPVTAAVTSSKSDTALTSVPKSPPSSSAASTVTPEKPAAATKELDETAKEAAKKSHLNPEAKEFVFTPKIPVNVVSNPTQVAPPQPAYNKANKIATVSINQQTHDARDSRQPTKNADMTTAQVMGPAITQQHPPYNGHIFIMHQQPNARVARIPSYPGNEGQPGQPHSMTGHPFLPHPFVAGAGHLMPGQQQMGHLPPPHSHNGQMSMSAPSGPPPNNVMPNPGTPSQPMHPQGPGYNHSAYHVNPVYLPNQQGGQQQAAGGQPPLQPSPHNPSPSPAPMPNGNAQAVAFNSYPPPAQQFYPTSVGPHPVSQAPPYAPTQQLVYIHNGGQFAPPVYPHAYPIPGYQQNYSGAQ